MEQNAGSNKWVWVVVGLVVIGLIVVFSRMQKGGGDEVAEPINEEAVEETAASETTPEGAAIVKPATVDTTPVDPDLGLSYTAAVRKYEGYRVQFGPDCTATPTPLTYKNGTKIMLDNRSNASQTIVLGSSRTVTLAPYKFAFTTLTANSFPTTHLVDCNKRQNVASITVQK